MAGKKSIETQFKAYYMAGEYLEANGYPGAPNHLSDVYGHELHAWDSWHEEGAQYGEEPPSYSPTLRDLNRVLEQYGVRVVGGKNMRVVKL